ncbi:MAG: EsaB/YukD family protein [Ktedonobacteraceae bacterium]
MQTILLTLVGPTRRIDLKLPAEVPVGELLPKMVELCVSPRLPQFAQAQWCLVIPGKGMALPPTYSLLACGVVDGAILLLQDHAAFVAKQQQAERSSFRPQVLQPGASTGGIGVKWNIPHAKTT